MVSIVDAAKKGNLEEVKALLDEGADIETKDSEGNTSLIAAADAGHSDIFNFLLERGANINAETEAGTALHAAARAGSTDMVKALLDKGADVDTLSYGEDTTPLISACAAGRSDVVKLLLERGANIELQDTTGQTALSAASQMGDLDIVKYLVDKGAKVSPDLAIYTAATDGRTDVVQFLLDKGADIETKNAHLMTPLFGAAEEGHTDTVQLLLDKGANIDSVNKHGNSPVYTAIKSGHLDTAKLLLDKGATITPKTANRLLVKVSDKGHTDLVKLLLDKGANIEYSYKRDTPILAATEKGHTDTIKLLIDRGANVGAKNKNGQDAMTIAKTNRFDDIVAVLEGRKFEPKGFEVRKFKDKDVYITTLPKGTLLFRGMDDLGTLSYDAFGIETGETYCLPPHYNVFFYPFPFVDASVQAYTHMVTYVSTQDIKLVALISPSPLLRSDRLRDGAAIVTCNNLTKEQHGCGLAGRGYDPCFNQEFLTANLDVTGMIALAETDQSQLENLLTQSDDEDEDEKLHLSSLYQKYFATFVDRRMKPGIPEIILYPRAVRNTTDVSTPGDTDVNTWYESNRDTTAYFPWITIKRKDDTIKDIVDKMTGAEGHDGKHVMLDKRTGFYVVKEQASPETINNLVEFKTGEEWNIAKDYPEFQFVHRELDGVPEEEGGKRRHTRRRTRRRKRSTQRRLLR